MIKFLIMKFIIFLYLIIFTTNIYANEIVFIDLNKIMNESIVGKYINDQIDIEKNKILEDFKKTEKKLKENEKQILSQKNLLKPDEFYKKVGEKGLINSPKKHVILDAVLKYFATFLQFVFSVFLQQKKVCRKFFCYNYVYNNHFSAYLNLTSLFANN